MKRSAFDMLYPTYESWKAQVDTQLMEMCGLKSDGLPDWDYRAAYTDKVGPTKAALLVLDAARNF
jgi:hypothetical protein